MYAQDGSGISGVSETIYEGQHEEAEPEDQEIMDLLVERGTPREPRIITTPPPKVTKKKMRFVKQREDPPKKAPVWNPVGEADL